jgi:exodeoxyribonuclease V beta subunit
MANEAYAEAVRLLYVAVTRAERRCYIFTTDFDKAEHSPLGRALKWQSHQNIEESLLQLVNDEPNSISLVTISTQANPSELIAEQAKLSEVSQLSGEVTNFNGKIERDWWLSSFTALSRNLRHGGVSSPDRDNSFEKLSGTEHQSNTMQASSLLRFNLAKGAHTGNLLHDILEHTDFIEPDWLQAMNRPLQKYGELTTGYGSEDLQLWLEQALNSPLTNNASLLNSTLLTDNAQPFSLADLHKVKTLRESEFYYPMCSASTDKLTNLLSKHRNMHSKSTQQSNVRLPAYNQLKGMMHGFIDLIFEHDNKYYICDYKSSHLGNDFSDYNHQAMKDNIEKNHYDLQYLIYSLALHRYLSHSLENYDVNTHFGGAYYLYLRGMTDDEKHKGCGVYYREIHVEELEELDQLFLGAQ